MAKKPRHEKAIVQYIRYRNTDGGNTDGDECEVEREFISPN